MKRTLRQATWMFALALAAALTFAVTPQFASAQSDRGMERGQGHDRDLTRNPNYQRGRTQGMSDGAANRSQRYRGNFNNDYDRQAYQAGYNQGFQDGRAQYNNRGNRGQYGRNGQYGQNGPYGQNNGQYGNNQAVQIGAQDGLNDGRTDRATGHSNRPTQGDNYKNALRGYNPSMGGENAYKALYRQGYTPAYQQGYTGRR